MTRDLVFRGNSFGLVELEDCGPLGDAMHAAGTPWHFHVLSPVCLHNPFAGHYALVIENDATHTAFVADAGVEFPEIDKHLVKLLHGKDILERPAPDKAAIAETTGLLCHMAGLQRAGTPWHHHMHFPSCVFNPHPGKWSISVESDNILFAEAFEAEPADILRQVEVIYFENLDASAGGKIA